MAEVSRIHDYFDALVRCREFAQDRDRPVLRGVVDEQVLVLVARDRQHRRSDLLVDLTDVAFFVVAGGEDGQQWHRGSFSMVGHESIPAMRRSR